MHKNILEQYYQSSKFKIVNLYSTSRILCLKITYMCCNHLQMLSPTKTKPTSLKFTKLE